MTKNSKQFTQVTICNQAGSWYFTTAFMFKDAAAVIDNLSQYMDQFVINDQDPYNVKVIVKDDYIPELVTMNQMLNIELARNGLIEFRDVFKEKTRYTSLRKDDPHALDNMNSITDIINLAKKEMPSEKDPYNFDEKDIRCGWHIIDNSNKEPEFMEEDYPYNDNDEEPEAVEEDYSYSDNDEEPELVEEVFPHNNPVDDAIKDIHKQAEEQFNKNHEGKGKFYALNLLEYAKYQDTHENASPDDSWDFWDDVDELDNKYDSILDSEPISDDGNDDGADAFLSQESRPLNPDPFSPSCDTDEAEDDDSLLEEGPDNYADDESYWESVRHKAEMMEENYQSIDLFDLPDEDDEDLRIANMRYWDSIRKVAEFMKEKPEWFLGKNLYTDDGYENHHGNQDSNSKKDEKNGQN